MPPSFRDDLRETAFVKWEIGVLEIEHGLPILYFTRPVERSWLGTAQIYLRIPRTTSPRQETPGYVLAVRSWDMR